MTRTTIREDEISGDVALTYYDDFQDRTVTRNFFTRRGGSVWEWQDNGDAKQVCWGLDSMGWTMTVAPGERLVDLIRREWKQRQAAARRKERRMRWG